MDTTNNTTALSPLQIFFTIIFVTTTFSSLIAYVLVLLILALYFKEFKSNFYYVVASLSIADIGFLMLGLFYMVPCSVLQKDIWLSTPYAAGLVESFSFFTECTHLTYIGFNRLVYASASGMKHPTLDKIFNSRTAVCFWILFLWISGVAVPVLVQIAGCYLMYDYKYMAFTLMCYHTISAQFTNQALFVDTFVSGLLPSFITASHFLAWCVIYYKSKKSGTNANNEITQQRKREKRLLIQFTLISLAMIMYYSSFWAVPVWFSDSPGLVLISLFGIASSAVNPFTYLIFNKLMKAKAKHLIFTVLLKKNNAVDSSPPVAGTPGHVALARPE